MVDFAVLADHRVKIKESQERDKYLDLVKKRLWDTKVTVIPIVVGALRTIPEELLKRLENLERSGKVEAIQTTALSRSAWILRRILEIWEDLLSLKLNWETIG